METKKKRGNFTDTINEIIEQGKERGILHLHAQDNKLDGRTLTVKGRELLNFGSCSYLGLELDSRLKKAAIKAICQYGVQFSSSRSYISCPLYQKWEALLNQIFNAYTITFTSVSLGHHAVMPIVVNEQYDAIILDQQVHASVQDAASKIQCRGVSLQIVRHNQLEDLEKKIEALKATGKCEKIWYMIDGIYSMYGDYAPLKELERLLHKHPQLHLYIDDAHGMSIAGKNGAGYALSQIALQDKIVLATSLNKAFGAGGGCFAFTDKKLYEKVKNTAGAYIFSGGHQIPVIGAGIAAAEIHLSEEIYTLQKELRAKNIYCHELLEEFQLPVISNPETPVFFIGLGLTRLGYNMVHRIINEGYNVNLGIFPAVPSGCTGLRFTINNHLSFEDINGLVNRLHYHLPKALSEEGLTTEDIHRSFRRIKTFKIKPTYFPSEVETYQVIEETTIRNIPKKEWNAIFQDKGMISWEGLYFLENTFTNNDKTEDNWKFFYFIIKDKGGKVVLATFFTEALVKDDMFARGDVSKAIEYHRKKDKYYLTSKSLMMGSLLTEGNHLFIDRTRADWEKTVMNLLRKVWNLQERINANTLSLRDFDVSDEELKSFFGDQGFVKLDLPDTHIVQHNTRWSSLDSFLSGLNRKKRLYIKQRVQDFEDLFTRKVLNTGNKEDVAQWHKLFNNVKDKNFEINTFDLPLKFFDNLASDDNWEVIELKLANVNSPVAVMLSFITPKSYNPVLVGMNYDYQEYCVYSQILWQTLKRANELKIERVNLGFTASQNKRKFGAEAVQQTAYVQTKDDYNLKVVNTFLNTANTFAPNKVLIKKSPNVTLVESLKSEDSNQESVFAS